MLPLTRCTAAVVVAVLATTPAAVTLPSASARASDVAIASPEPPRTPPSTQAAERRARRAYAALPLAFEANRGQVDEEVRFLARGEGFDLYLTQQGPVFDLHAPGSRRSSEESSAAAVLLDPVGADPTARIVGRRHEQTTAGYFLGDDPSKWERAVPTFSRARYQELYPGIDMVLRGDRTGAEYDFAVSPGGDPSRIAYRLRGADSLHVDDGALVATTAAGDFVHHAPVAYQRIDGRRRAVESAFHLRHGVVTFELGSYDKRRPLVIDPVTDIEYGTYLGGDDYDGSNAVAVADGDVYLTGYARSADFPTTIGAYDSTASAQSNVFVARMSPDGAGAADLVYSTFLGGNGNVLYDEEGLGIAVENGEIYLTGVTRSSNFPTTAGALDSSLAGDTEGFFAKISPDGAGAADLAYSTFLGGGGYDSSQAIAVADGDAYLTGWTTSASFPTTQGAYDTTLVDSAAFLARISPDGAGSDDLVYGSFLGAAGSAGSGIALDAGDVFVTGHTGGSFPTTVGAYDRSANGEDDAFVARLSPDGAGSVDLVYSTLVGGTGDDFARGIAVDDGDLYVTGVTESASWPTTTGAHDRTWSRQTDGFVVRLSPDSAGSADLVYSTYLSSMDTGTGIAVDGGEVYVAGYVSIYDKYGDYYYGVVARLSLAAAGSPDLRHLTFLDESSAEGIAVVGGVAYVTGWTDSYTLTTPGAYDTTHNGLPSDAFLLLLDTPDNQVWPDGLIRRGNGPDIGDDVYDASPTAQTVSTRSRKRQLRTFWFTAQNDDDLAEVLTITGAGATSARFVIRYYRDGVNITSQVTGPGYQTDSLAPGASVLIKLTIKPRATARIGQRKLVPVTLTSGADPTSLDVVAARVTVRRR